MEIDVGKAGEGGLACGSKREVVNDDEEDVRPRIALHRAHVEEGEQGGSKVAAGHRGGAGEVGRVVEVVGDVCGEGKGLSTDTDEVVADTEELEKGNIGNGEAESVEESAQFGERIDGLEEELAAGLVEGGGEVKKELGLRKV